MASRRDAPREDLWRPQIYRTQLEDGRWRFVLKDNDGVVKKTVDLDKGVYATRLRLLATHRCDVITTRGKYAVLDLNVRILDYYHDENATPITLIPGNKPIKIDQIDVSKKGSPDSSSTAATKESPIEEGPEKPWYVKIYRIKVGNRVQLVLKDVDDNVRRSIELQEGEDLTRVRLEVHRCDVMTTHYRYVLLDDNISALTYFHDDRSLPRTLAPHNKPIKIVQKKIKVKKAKKSQAEENSRDVELGEAESESESESETEIETVNAVVVAASERSPSERVRQRLWKATEVVLYLLLMFFAAILFIIGFTVAAVPGFFVYLVYCILVGCQHMRDHEN